MKNKIKVLIGVLILSLSITNANAENKAGALNLIKKHPFLSAGALAGSAIYMQTAMHKARHLSYHLPEVEPYFNKNPQDYKSVAEYVFKALLKPANKNDYDRYKKLAERMGLEGIPPYSPPPVNHNNNVLDNPIQEGNPNDNILENPIKEEQFSNIITTPQGEKYDTSTEFPLEEPKDWNEYLILKNQDSTELGKNLVAAEQRNNPNYIRPDNVQGHHLISATSPDTEKARAILAKYLNSIIGPGEQAYNHEINGVFLPDLKNTDFNIPGIEHNGRHPRAYNQEVNRRIVNADTNGGWPAVQKELNDIKQELLNANRTTKWKDVL